MTMRKTTTEVLSQNENKRRHFIHFVSCSIIWFMCWLRYAGWQCHIVDTRHIHILCTVSARLFSRVSEVTHAVKILQVDLLLGSEFNKNCHVAWCWLRGNEPHFCHCYGQVIEMALIPSVLFSVCVCVSLSISHFPNVGAPQSFHIQFGQETIFVWWKLVSIFFGCYR